MDPNGPELAGAKRILRGCLGLVEGQSLVIVLDETTVETAAVLVEAADLEGIPHSAFLVPVAVQRRIPAKSDLSFTLQAAAHDARAILTCVNARPDCLRFRDRILETQWSARTRLGHMPGADLDVLKLANVDMAKLVADCHLLEEAMARGRTLELLSRAANGAIHRLTADIGGWSRLPVASNGIIGDGVWGNVPSGETYIAPIEGSAEGSVVINGSIPGLVILDNGEVVLYFSHGCLERIEPPDNAVARWLEVSQIERAREIGDLNWRNLAEIGIGVNPGVKKLTGNMLFDEKTAATAHVAIGDNRFMGGTVEASIHCDMLMLAPSVVIDSQTIVEFGQLVPELVRERYSEVDLALSPLRDATKATRSGTEATWTEAGRIQRTLRGVSGGVSGCQVGDNETAHLAGAVYRLLPESDDWLEIPQLAKQAHLPEPIVRCLLHVLWSYELINWS